MVDVPTHPIGDVMAATPSANGAGIIVDCRWTDGERFMLLLPVHLAARLHLNLQVALGETLGQRVEPTYAEGAFLQPSSLPGKEVLTLRLAGGANLHFLVDEGRYAKGILHLGHT